MFCLAGLLIGTVTGYYISINWKPASPHVHHIKSIACHHYYGIEVYMIYLIIISSIDINIMSHYYWQGVLMIDDSEMPTIKKSNELLVQVKAASLNVIDTKICSGYSRIYRRLLNSGVSKLFPSVH